MTRPPLRYGGLVNLVTRYALRSDRGMWFRLWVGRLLLRVVYTVWDVRVLLHWWIGLPLPRSMHRLAPALLVHFASARGAGGGHPQSLPSEPRQGPKTGRGDCG